MDWDPEQYGRYDDERSRPFVDLVARIGRRVAAPRGRPRLRHRRADRVAGRERWPGARVEGIDCRRR